MQKTGSRILLSATDLSFFMGCNHATWLDLQVALGKLNKPPKYEDAALKTLQEKGQKFEEDVLNKLVSEGKTVVRIGHDYLTAAGETIAAMKSGADIIYQGRLEDGQWAGWADFLVKVDRKSRLGDWSYEVKDTKFAKHTRAGSVLQITLYSDMLAKIQGIQPEHMYIKTPEKKEPYRVDDYIAYFRLMRRKLLDAIELKEEVTYPHPVELCDICKWWQVCNERRRKDDHLAFIAGMGSSQTREVKNWEVHTLKSMAILPLPIPHEPTRGNIQTYVKLREQARVQLQAREEKRNVHEILPLQEEMGFHQLPKPSGGDIFFDFEGDPFVGSTGREYLFGWVHKGEYRHIWATTDQEEKKALEQFVDRVMDTWNNYPDMHIYHFTAYEPSALKRLMGKYATREDQVDRLLRGKVFVDLHAILKHSVRAGVEAYSLKEMERMHNFKRQRDLKLVRQHKTLYETLLENDNIDVVEEETKNVVRDYNMEDCISAQSLRDWLEQLREEEIRKGSKIERPVRKEDDPSENITAHLQRIQPIFEALTKDVNPFDRSLRSDEQHARWLLAHMLDWYRREQKSVWWNFLRLKDLDEEALLDESEALSGLRFNGKEDVGKQSVVHYYNFPDQETEIKQGEKVECDDGKSREVVFLDKKERVVGIKKGKKVADFHPKYLIQKKIISQKEKEESIIRFAQWVVDNGVDSSDSLAGYRAGRDLLLRKLPRIREAVTASDNAQDKAVDWVSKLDNGVLPVQGPPGTGKSHTAARMIVDLVKQEKRIGITALSHKVISSLIEKVIKAAKDENVDVHIVQKAGDNNTTPHPNWLLAQEYNEIEAALHNKKTNIVAGTAFMWAREQFREAVDVLFVDEAGQLSLIDTIAVSHAGKNLVLLGDPQQLQQPQKGDHPEGTEVSSLAHILDGEDTISEEKGVFLDETWRMHPAICNYVSEMFYSGRLHARSANNNQQLLGDTFFRKPGIHVIEVSHQGNSNQSPEEVKVIQHTVKELLSKNVEYITSKNETHKLTSESIKIISPYNAQVNAISLALPNIKVGTVDKFQGQEAEVIIFSMATSSPADAPRGMDFLYSLNRLNVAVSRAKAVFILIANPALFEPDCHSPHQMKLANALCRLLESSHNGN
ncbi:MAG: TM0106 family RecB-like putative nuclease [Chitinophagaceae bacterium]|nr:TM0106 family RecB-like putative nuclease [Chitinophagaceae bacterium]